MRGEGLPVLVAAFLVVLVPGGGAGAAAGETVRVGTPPAVLAAQSGERLGGDFARAEVPVATAPAGERGAVAASWLAEAFAPADAPACREVLAALHLPAAGPAPGVLAAAWPADRPAAEDGARGRLLVPAKLPPLSPPDLEVFRLVGLVPFEIAATGEWARAVAFRHLGPPPADPLLRAARAARAEGTCRLAGILVTVTGAGLAGDDAGRALPELDRDGAGWPRERLRRLGLDPLRRALAETCLRDGLRWAAWAWLRGGWRGLAAALERPGIGPAELLVPARRGRTVAGKGETCRLGPRASGLLLVGDPDAPLVDRLLEDHWSALPGGRRLRATLRVEEGAVPDLLGGLPDGARVLSVRGSEVTVEVPARPLR